MSLRSMNKKRRLSVARAVDFSQELFDVAFNLTQRELMSKFGYDGAMSMWEDNFEELYQRYYKKHATAKQWEKHMKDEIKNTFAPYIA